jgi:hypothetical protein
MAKRKAARRFVLCVSNERYPASLEIRKIYEAIPDEAAATRSFVRVIDESGEDYLYPEAMLIPVELPKEATHLFAQAS